MSSAEAEFKKTAHFETHRLDDNGIVPFDVVSRQRGKTETEYKIVPPSVTDIPDFIEDHMVIESVHPDIRELRAKDRLLAEAAIAALAHAAFSEVAQLDPPPVVFALRDISHDRNLLEARALVQRYYDTLGMKLAGLTSDGEAILVGDARTIATYADNAFRKNNIIRSRYLPGEDI